MKNKHFHLFPTFLIIVFLISSNIFAGTSGKVVGIVTDAQTGEPIPGVNVLIDGTFLGAATDLEGYYIILNVPPGEFKMEALMIGYTTSTMIQVRVNIDQTTEINFELSEETLEISETIEVIAKRPIVERDVAASRANMNIKEVEALPIVNVTGAIGLQAGVQGMSIRGGYLSETAFMVNGIALRDERNNTPYTGISLTSVEEIQVQTGGFSAEFGNIRSGVVNIVTKEGKRDKYDFSFLGRYKAASSKHFGHSINSPDAYWIRPYLDPQVAFEGTEMWDEHTKAQFPEFRGFNSLAEKLLLDDDPTNDLTPLQLQQLFLFERRKVTDINAPDYSYDMSFGGPVPFIGKDLGNLRFHTSYRSAQTMYIMPVSDDGYRDYNWQLKFNSDVGNGMKLLVEGLIGRETGTADNNSGYPGIFQSSWEIPSYIDYGFSYAEGATFGTDYWSRAAVDYNSVGARFTHALNPTTYYEVYLHRFHSAYDTNPGEIRDYTKKYQFGPEYFADEAAYGWTPNSPDASIITGMNMGTGFGNARDTSRVTAYTAKFDLASQIDKYNFIKTGAEFTYTESNINYAVYDPSLTSKNRKTQWNRNPVRAAIYISDKLEFEEMVAQVGLRLDYSNAGGDWYVYDPFTDAFNSQNSDRINEILPKEPIKHIFNLSPRLAIAFPITEDSKLYFNYGHFRQLPTPENLFRLRKSEYYNNIVNIADPNNPLPKTVAYELGYEHNISDQFLLRTAGYYKDISEEPRNIQYINSDGSVNYYRSEPNNYRDIRGFEITFNKTRGSWIRGFLNYTYMVTSSGKFGWGRYYESSADQREYLLGSGRTYHYQSKPKPRPYARANIDLFTPDEYGPAFSGLYPVGSWRLNILASWSAGSWTKWYGGQSSTFLDYNVQWRDNWYCDIRLAKKINLVGMHLEFFLDINNVFNFKQLRSYGFSSGEDGTNYYKSLHFAENTDGNEYWAYVNIPGDDQPGDYRKSGVSYTPIIGVNNRNEIRNPNTTDLYYEAGTRSYLRYNDDGSWRNEDPGRVQRILDDKAYIDMPNFQYFTFLNPRSFFWGLKVSFEL